MIEFNLILKEEQTLVGPSKWQRPLVINTGSLSSGRPLEASLVVWPTLFSRLQVQQHLLLPPLRLPGLTWPTSGIAAFRHRPPCLILLLLLQLPVVELRSACRFCFTIAPSVTSFRRLALDAAGSPIITLPWSSFALLAAAAAPNVMSTVVVRLQPKS